MLNNVYFLKGGEVKMKKLMLRTVGVFFAGALGLGFSIFGIPKGAADATTYCSNGNEGLQCYYLAEGACGSAWCPDEADECIIFYTADSC